MHINITLSDHAVPFFQNQVRPSEMLYESYFAAPKMFRTNMWKELLMQVFAKIVSFESLRYLNLKKRSEFPSFRIEFSD